MSSWLHFALPKRCGLACIIVLACWGWLTQTWAKHGVPSKTNFYQTDLHQLYFNNISPQTMGLQPFINAIEQDSRGFIWFGTQNGLHRYDGKSMRHYNFIPGDSSSLSNNWIRDLHVDGEGRLWVATDSGINLYLAEQDAFKSFSPNAVKYPNLLAEEFLVIAEAHDGSMWFGSRDAGLTLYNPQRDTFTAFQLDPANPESLSSNKITGILVDKTNNLWVATEDAGIAIKLAGSQDFIHLNEQSAQPFPSNNIADLFQDKQGTIWIATKDKGLYAIDFGFEVTKAYRHDENNGFSLCSDEVGYIQDDNVGRLWLATAKGLCEFNLETQRFYLYQHESGRPTSLISNAVKTLYQDDGGVMWVGTFGGVSSWNADVKNFTHISQDFGVGSQLSVNLITSFAQDAHGNLYVGTWDGGVNQIDTNTSQFTHLKDTGEPGSIKDNRVMSLLVDDKDTLWVGTYQSGLFKRKSGEQHFENYRHDPEDPNTISSNAISKIIQLASGEIAVATYGGGLNILPADGQIKHFKHIASDPSSLSSDRLLDLVQSADGNIWLATNGGGLNRVDLQRNEITRFVNDPDDPNSIPSNNIYTLLDTENYLWIGTQQVGLLRFTKHQSDTHKSNFEYFSINNRVPIQVVFGLLDDENGNIWFTHPNGISQIASDGTFTRTFNSGHGLQSSDFTAGANFKAKNGRMFFGGSNGFYTFFPNNPPVNRFNAPMALLSFSIFNHDVPLYKAFRDDGVIELKHSDSVIGFKFAVLDFTKPSDNQYQYKVDGLHDEWVDAGSNNEITFSNLADGTYTLRVRGANSDGYWSEQELEVQLEVMPPPWKTIYAYVVYLIILISILYRVYQRQQQKEQAQLRYQQKLESEVEQRTNELKVSNQQLAETIIEKDVARARAEDAAKAKSDFLATMSHEIRTPMNSILGMGELLLNTHLNPLQRRYASTAHRSGEMLLELINDILDFSKMEVSKIALEHIAFDVHSLIEESVFYIAGRAHEKDVQIGFNVATDCPTFIMGDPLRLRQILTNLIGNAIKFTEYGCIVIDVSCEDNRLQIAVSDSGIGMSEQQQQKIFQPFEQADSTTTRKFGGSGLGLTITKTLVELMKGEISVTSEQHKGSKFIVSLPLEAAQQPTGEYPLAEFGSITVAVLAFDEPTKSMLLNCLERMQMNYFEITSVSQLTSVEQQKNIIYLVDEAILQDLSWLHGIIEVQSSVIVMTQLNHDQDDLPIASLQILNKPIQRHSLVESIKEKMGLRHTSENVISPLEFGQNYIFEAKILVVDDSKTNQQVASDMLTLLGCKVEIADHGMMAIEKVKTSHFDLILMDCQMPVMDGFECTRELRILQNVQHIARLIIVALTAGMGSHYRQECLDAGMDDCMLKPFTAKQLLATLQHYLGDKIVAKKVVQNYVLDSQEPAATVDEDSPLAQYINTETVNTIVAVEKQTGRKIFSRVIETFKTEMQHKIPELLNHYQQGDAENLALLAHSIKSITGNVGAKKLEVYCQIIEKAGIDNNLAACSDTIDKFSACYEKTLSYLDTFTA
ncbi:two-component regulator propeller domain-containing protein [Aliiglaciecola sp. LCG003]|uniref:two-component regulator propeller domain-containing protein n=1 Tax=Aliiglaciecola sp. LCG003 TaxID=3053655 RepID=UPI0025742247|nr:two-component regulator propeller domain-containing protein [Aliiglaciecola sp. LCG003]WJG07934.1 two-component regulator propeller domain-containing protein [Aliiglaciecola sp. LCG003]